MNEEQIKALLNDAVKASEKAYAPYSKFPVGCAIVLRNGQRFFGVNIENAAYAVAICAERAAMAPIITAGLQDEIAAVAVITHAEIPGTPCGVCRQFLSEFLKRDTPIFCGNADGKYQEFTMAELLPHAFDRSSLELA